MPPRTQRSRRGRTDASSVLFSVFTFLALLATSASCGLWMGCFRAVFRRAKEVRAGVARTSRTEAKEWVRCALIELGLVFATLVKLSVGHSSAIEESTAARRTAFPGFLARLQGNRRSQVGAANRARSPIDWYHLKSHRFSPAATSRHALWRFAFPSELYVIEGGGWRHKRVVDDTRLRRDCRQDNPRPDINIPGSHPGHQTRNHPARKGGNISSRLFSRKRRREIGGFQGFRRWRTREMNRRVPLVGLPLPSSAFV